MWLFSTERCLNTQAIETNREAHNTKTNGLDRFQGAHWTNFKLKPFQSIFLLKFEEFAMWNPEVTYSKNNYSSFVLLGLTLHYVRILPNNMPFSMWFSHKKRIKTYRHFFSICRFIFMLDWWLMPKLYKSNG